MTGGVEWSGAGLGKGKGDTRESLACLVWGLTGQNLIKLDKQTLKEFPQTSILNANAQFQINLEMPWLKLSCELFDVNNLGEFPTLLKVKAVNVLVQVNKHLTSFSTLQKPRKPKLLLCPALPHTQCTQPACAGADLRLPSGGKKKKRKKEKKKTDGLYVKGLHSGEEEDGRWRDTDIHTFLHVWMYTCIHKHTKNWLYLLSLSSVTYYHHFEVSHFPVSNKQN